MKGSRSLFIVVGVIAILILGWWLVGRTPERMFSPARKDAFLAAVGDAIKFESIDVDTFNALDVRAAAGEVVAKVTKLA